MGKESKVKKLEREKKALEAFHEVSRAITSGLELDKVLKLIVKSANEVLEADCSVVYPYDQAKGEFLLDLVAAEGIERVTFYKQKPRVSGTAETVMREECIVVENTCAMEHYPFLSRSASSFIRREEIKSFVGVSLKVRSEIVGILYINFRTHHRFDEDEQKIIEIFADQAAIAIQNARLFERASERIEQSVAELTALHEINWLFELTGEELEQKVAELKALQEIDKAISSTLDLDKVLALILETGLEKTGASLGSVWLVDEVTGELVVQARHGAIMTDMSRARIKIGEGIAGRVAKERRTYLVPDVSKCKDFEPFIKGTKSKVAVPILQEDKLIGVLSVDSPEIDAFDEDDVRFLEALASQVVIAIQNAERYEALAKANKALREEHEKRLAAERIAIMGSIASNLAHRMGTDVGTIPVCVQEIEGALPPDLPNHELIMRYLHRIKEDATHLLEVAEQLRKPFKPERVEFVDVNLLLDAALRKTMIPKNVQVVTEYASGLPRTSIATLLVDVFKNIIDNAVEAMPDGGVLTVRSNLVTDRHRRWIEVKIADTGCGISEDVREKIFNLFYTTKGRMGLGLWWSKTFLREVGGDIYVESEVGKGSTFYIRLPIEER